MESTSFGACRDSDSHIFAASHTIDFSPSLPSLRNQRPPDPGRVEWLVAFPIEGHSPDRIAKDYRDPDTKQPRLSNTVFKAIQSEVRKIDLALRPHRYRARETRPISRQKIT